MDRALGAILGALTADAASLGLHWLYDQGRLAELAATASPAFREPDARNYQGVAGYFAHGGKRAGDLSGYGEGVVLMLRHLARHEGRFQRCAYQAEFRNWFGPGGGYVGYVDRPTRLALATLAAIEDPAGFPGRSGADDDQMPALECVPALAAVLSRGAADAAAREASVEEAVVVLSTNAIALDGARTLARALFALIAGEPLSEALERAASAAGGELAPLLRDALAMQPFDPAAAARRFGLPCHMAQGLPVAFHVARHAPDFRTAVEGNILAGGDSCGRAIAVGALTGAAFGAEGGIPPSWLARVCGMSEIAALGERLLAA
jgi:ADP-ribosylglycohydrolase